MSRRILKNNRATAFAPQHHLGGHYGGGA